ncbi:MAG: hypothetical protein ACPGUV_10255, partial [Polyangiales bacterium]
VFAIHIFLFLSMTLLGPGYLYRLVSELAWVGGLIVGYGLLRHWRESVFSAYSKVFVSGTLSQWVQGHRGRPLGVVLLIPAFLAVAARSMALYVRDVAMRFDRTRKALAYVFRRRLERQQEQRFSATGQLQRVPDAVRQACTATRLHDGIRVDRFVGLTETLGAIDAWRRHGRGCSVAIIGEPGIGKSCWLRQLQARLAAQDTASLLRSFRTRSCTSEAVCHALGEMLELPEGHDVQARINTIAASPASIYLLDRCELMLQRSVGGMQGIDAFGQIVQRTLHRTAWVCAFTRYAWQHFRYLTRDQNIFQHVHRLDSWSEEEIRSLIEKRMRHCGYAADFDALADERKRGVPLDDEERERIQERYLRLLWDQSSGVPRLALHFWLRSLHPASDNQVAVRLFNTRSPDELERLGEQARFALYAVVSHGALSLSTAVEVLQYPQHQCLALFEYLRGLGCLELVEGAYRVSLEWSRAAHRYLRRKHLLYE